MSCNPQENLERKHLKLVKETKIGKVEKVTKNQEGGSFHIFEDKAQEGIVKEGKKERSLRKYTYPKFIQ